MPADGLTAGTTLSAIDSRGRVTRVTAAAPAELPICFLGRRSRRSGDVAIYASCVSVCSEGTSDCLFATRLLGASRYASQAAIEAAARPEMPQKLLRWSDPEPVAVGM
jgi:hypothetical protein